MTTYYYPWGQDSAAALDTPYTAGLLAHGYDLGAKAWAAKDDAEFAPTAAAAQSAGATAWAAPPPAANEPDRPLRLAHVGPCMLRGGSEQWLISLARALDPARARVDRCIVGLPNLVDPEVVSDVGAPVEVGTEGLRRAARECDALLFWGVPLQEWLGPVRPKVCVYVAHGEGDWTREGIEKSSGVINHVVAVSERVGRRVCHDVPHTVIPNGVSTRHLTRTCPRDEMRRRLGFAPDDFVLGFVGRFSQEKRPQVVLDAVAQLPPNFKALMVGWGAMHDELTRRANVRLPGRYAFRTASSNLGDYYQAMDALCLVSEHEGFGLVMLEAMMCRCPVIATAVGAAPELIRDRVTGLLVGGSPSSVADAARLLQAHPDWARGVAAEGHRLAERTGHASQMARAYENLFERLCGERGGAHAAQSA